MTTSSGDLGKIKSKVFLRTAVADHGRNPLDFSFSSLPQFSENNNKNNKEKLFISIFAKKVRPRMIRHLRSLDSQKANNRWSRHSNVGHILLVRGCFLLFYECKILDMLQ